MPKRVDPPPVTFKDVPPVCPGTEGHFELHAFNPLIGGPTLIYWPDPGKPRFWSHDSDYPWFFSAPGDGQASTMPGWQKEHVARHQAGAWDDLSTENGDQAATNANEWRAWEKV